MRLAGDTKTECENLNGKSNILPHRGEKKRERERIEG